MYTIRGCSLCSIAREIISRVLEEIPFEFHEVDIESKDDLYERVKEDAPVVFVNGEPAFTHRVSERKLRRILRKERLGQWAQ